MSNVVSMAHSCDYLVHRAAVRRRKGNYAEAMTLLSKAKAEYGLRDEIEIEFARIYDEIGCEEDAARSYLRIVRLGGKHYAEALFQLALSSMQRGDSLRASSYLELFLQSGREGVAPEYAQLLKDQLDHERSAACTWKRKARVKALLSRGLGYMHAGRTQSARRVFEHALRLRESAQVYTLLACCALLEGDADQAVLKAQRAHAMAPGRVQATLVLADAYSLAGNENEARRWLHLAALRCQEEDDYLAAAIESAKRGEHKLTLLLTRRLLRLEPCQTQGMMLRACAYASLGRMKEAGRIFGRVCTLRPEDSVSAAYYRMFKDGKYPDEIPALGFEVPYEVGTERAAQLVAALYISREDLQSDAAREHILCRYADWAFHSQLAGDQVALAALLAMCLMKTERSLGVLQDALTDPRIDDAFKHKILQALSGLTDTRKLPVDLGGKLVHLAAGATVEAPRISEHCRNIVQLAADELLPSFSDAPGILLSLWLCYLRAYGEPSRSHAKVCVAALEYAYHAIAGRTACLKAIARKHALSPRLTALYARRMLHLYEALPENGISHDHQSK